MSRVHGKEPTLSIEASSTVTRTIFLLSLSAGSVFIKMSFILLSVEENKKSEHTMTATAGTINCRYFFICILFSLNQNFLLKKNPAGRGGSFFSAGVKLLLNQRTIRPTQHLLLLHLHVKRLWK